MIEPSSVRAVENSDATVIDFKTAKQRITSDRLAAALFDLAEGESVRVIEALASAMINNLNSDKVIDRPFACERVRLLQYPNAISDDGDAKVAAFRRIARRALRGTLCDPTRGANTFHRIETAPDWSRDLLPVAVVGQFLFYRQ